MNLFYCAFAAVALTPSAFAQVQLVTYGTSNPATGGLPPASSNSAVDATNIVAGAGITRVTNAGTFNYQGWDSSDFLSAVAANEFWRWGFSVSDPTKLIDLTELKLRVDRSGSGPTDFQILVEVFSDTTLTAPVASSVAIQEQGFSNDAVGVEFAFDLTALPTLGGSNFVRFTLVALSATSGSGTFDLEVLSSSSTSAALIISGIVDSVSAAPSMSAMPSAMPSSSPSAMPSIAPSSSPSQSAMPSNSPSGSPSESPTRLPSSQPSVSSEPSSRPSRAPSSLPSSVPTSMPTSVDECNCTPLNFYCRLICLVLRILRFFIFSLA